MSLNCTYYSINLNFIADFSLSWKAISGISTKQSSPSGPLLTTATGMNASFYSICRWSGSCLIRILLDRIRTWPPTFFYLHKNGIVQSIFFFNSNFFCIICMYVHCLIRKKKFSGFPFQHYLRRVVLWWWQNRKNNN